MNKLNVLAEEILVKVAGKRVLCKAILLSDKGGHVVSYLVDGVEVKSQPLYRSPFKDKVKEIKALKAEQAPKQEQPLSEQLETLKKACVSMGVTNQQLSEKYAIPLSTLEAWYNGTPPEDFVINLLLRCLEVDFIADIDLSEEEQEQLETVPKPYNLYNSQGEPLTPAEEEFVHRERAAGRTTKMELSEDEDPYCTRQVYCCDSNNFKFEIIKEV